LDPSASFGGWIGLLFSSGIASSDAFAIGVLAIGLAAVCVVHGSLAYHLARISDLCRDLEDLYRSRPGGKPESRLRDLEKMMADSLVVGAWSELLRKRHDLEARAPDDGAPIRFGDLLEQYPLIPNGIRRSLLGSMPLLLAGLGVSASLAALAVGLATLEADGSVSPVVGLGLRGAFWGLVLATAAGLASKLLEGSSRDLGTRLSTLIERTYRVVSHDEVSLRIAEAQLAGQERNSLLLLRLTKDLRESLSAGLGRIETAATSAADAANHEQRLALESVTQDIASQLQHRLEDQLSALRTSMELSASSPEAAKKSEGEEASPTSDALERAAQAVEQAAAALARSAEPSNEEDRNLGEVAGVLEQAVEQIQEAQQEAGEDGASADALAGLREEVTRMHEQMVESVMAARENSTADAEMAMMSAGGTADGAEEGRSGYSALLQRYQAPRFSLDELAPELRTFDTEAAIERARNSGRAPDPVTPAAAEVPAAMDVPELDDAPEFETESEFDTERELRDEDAEGPAADEQRLRLAQFLKRR
jgi:hypothetical protein